MISNGGFFVPDNLVRERFTFFAAKNIDFKDTSDGKSTFHGDVMVIYQRKFQPSFSDFSVNDQDRIIYVEQYRDIAIYFAKTLLINPLGNRLEPYTLEDIICYLCDNHDTPILITDIILNFHLSHTGLHSPSLPTTRIQTLPLIAAPSHEYRTLLTILKQAQGINLELMGSNQKMISLLISVCINQLRSW